MGGSTISQSATRIEALKLQSSSYGVTVPLVYGKAKVAGNLVWYGGFAATSHTETQGGKGGAGIESTTYTYTADVVMLLAHGQISAVPTIWRGKKNFVSGADTALAQVGMSLQGGAIGQPVWSGLASYGNQALGYSGFATIAAQAYGLESGAQMENHLFEVVAQHAYHLGALVPDVDPSLVLTDVLSTSRAGAGLAASMLGDWSHWSNWCVASGLLVSPVLDTQQRAAEVLRTAARLTMTEPVWIGGKLKMVPYADAAVTGNGRTFTPDATPVYDLDDDCWLDAPVGQIKSPADRYNHVRVEYLDRAQQYSPAIATATDAADIDANGKRSMDLLQAHWICDAQVAQHVAQLLMQRSLHIANTYTAPLPWHFALLEPMDLVRMTDPGLGLALQAARITVIEEGNDGELSCTLEDYPAGVSSSPRYASQVPSGFAHDFNAAPDAIDAPVIFEAPATLTATGLEVWAAVRGPSAAWGGCQVWVSLDGTSYRQAATMFGGARYGVLSIAASGGSSLINISGLGPAQLLSTSAVDAAALSTLCYLGGAAPEYLAYQTATLTSAGSYDLSGLVRGAHGTAATAHSAGVPFVRVDDRLAKSGALDLSFVGKVLHFKFPSFNIFGAAQQSLADVPAYSYTVTGAMALVGVRLGAVVYRQASDPAATLFVPAGALWYETDNGNAEWLRQGNAWVSLRDGTIAAAQQSADEALAAIGDMGNDNVLTPVEKPRIILDRDVIVAEKAGIEAQADNLAVTTEKATYLAAVADLVAYLATLASPVAWDVLTGNTAVVGSTFRGKFAAVYTSRQAVLDKITANAKARLGALATMNAVGTAQIEPGATTVVAQVYAEGPIVISSGA